jgi:hypothetical protein
VFDRVWKPLTILLPWDRRLPWPMTRSLDERLKHVKRLRSLKRVKRGKSLKSLKRVDN